MEGKKYISEAIKTESYKSEEIKGRFNDNLNDLLGTMLDTFNYQAENMDLVKKHLFYGKEVDLPGLTNTDSGSSLLKTPLTPNLTRLLHGVLGIITEAGEMSEQLHAHMYQGKKLDEVNIAEEIGDIFWYCAVICDTVGISFESLMDKNIEKLRARYGDKFSNEKAINRDLDTERKVLEKEH